jgi:hypothetical protein
LDVKCNGEISLMKVIITTILFFISVNSFGQSLQDSILTEMKPYDLGNKVNLRQLAGSYTMSDGMGGYTYRLDSCSTFERVDFADLGGCHVSVRGTIELNSNGQMVLVSDKVSTAFNVFAFDTFVFFVRPSKTFDFKRDFTQAVSWFGKKAVYTLKGETYTAMHMIAFSLASKYLVKGVD